MKASEQAKIVRRLLGVVMKAETALLETVLDTNRTTNPEAVWSRLDEGELNAIKRRVAIHVKLDTKK